MQKILRNFFSNDIVFTVSTILTVFTMLASCVYFIPSKNYMNVFYNIALAIAFAVMYLSFRSHSKNVMKGIIGLSLGITSFLFCNRMHPTVFLEFACFKNQRRNVFDCAGRHHYPLYHQCGSS